MVPRGGAYSVALLLCNNCHGLSLLVTQFEMPDSVRKWHVGFGAQRIDHFHCATASPFPIRLRFGLELVGLPLPMLTFAD
jgi:hypothetical protein